MVPHSYFKQLIYIFVIAMSWILSYLFRFHYLKDGQKNLELLFFKVGIIIILTSLYFLHKSNTHKKSSKRFLTDLFPLLKGNTFAILSVVILLYFFAEERLSRIVLFLHFIISSGLLILANIVMRKNFFFKGKNSLKVLLVGNGKQMEDYISIVRSSYASTIHIISWLDSDGLATKHDIPSDDLSLDKIGKKYNPNMFIVGYASKDSSKTDCFLKTYHNDIIPIMILSDVSYSLIGSRIETFEDIPIININIPKISFTEMILKRLFDITFSITGILILSPLLIVIAILIKIDSKGSVIFKQDRIGLDGKNFTMWKFRTMISTNKQDTNWSSKDNPHKTIIGRILRKTSLDELPQLWNVLLGDMSIVGPRPERSLFVEKFRHEIPAYMLRHKMKTGMTGWAQINGFRGDSDLKKRIQHDIYYIKNWSLWFDIKIILLTFLRGFNDKNAY